jgi:hypothetical protein
MELLLASNEDKLACDVIWRLVPISLKMAMLFVC